MRSDQVDLTNCDQEPIHIPGAIQPHGALVACSDHDLRITQVSDNAYELFEVPNAERLIGTPLLEWFTPQAAAVIEDASEAQFPRERNPLAVTLKTGRRFDAIAHRGATPGITIVEFEPFRRETQSFDARIRSAVRRLQHATTKSALVETAAAEVRGLTGFDRVMVYEFDADWHGHVIAESKRDDLESFLGLHYPASDIPAQARRLYTLNWLRIIPDVAYQPARLVPPLDPPSGLPLDLSFSVLRSVSPIHIQYLKNMGVTASMSMSLIINNQLSGLVACHHYSGPHHVPFVTRDTAEYLGQALSWHLATLSVREKAERELVSQRATAQLVSSLATAPSVPAGLADPAILELTDATGAAIVFEGQIHHVGRIPSHGLIQRLVRVLKEDDGGPIVSTDHLVELVPEAAFADDLAAGVLGVEISRELGEYIFWFRPSSERSVNWAGDPRKGSDPSDADAPDRLSPRGSFALWREIVRGRSLPWAAWHVEAASDLRTLLIGRIRKRAVELHELNQRLAAADRSKDEFLATVSHELRTPLNAILGWTQMLRSGSISGERQARALETVERSARAQAKLIEDLLDVSRIMSGTLQLDVEPLQLASIIDQTTETLRPALEAKSIGMRTLLDSTATVLGDQQRLQQVVTNLLSNAVKFTSKGGKVEVVLERRDSSAEIRVADTGCGISTEFLPHIFERFRQADATATRKSGGLGLGLAIVRHIVELHGGTVEAFSEGQGKGSTFTVRLPVAISHRKAATPVLDSQPQSALPCPPPLDGLRILVVDDELDARELLEALFTECKAVVASASSSAEALALLESFRPDVLVSDIGMPGEDGYALIAKIRQRPADRGGKTPAIALTAYARAEDRARVLLSGFQSHIAKPVEPVEILALVASLASMQTKPK